MCTWRQSEYHIARFNALHYKVDFITDFVDRVQVQGLIHRYSLTPEETRAFRPYQIKEDPIPLDPSYLSQAERSWRYQLGQLFRTFVTLSRSASTFFPFPRNGIQFDGANAQVSQQVRQSPKDVVLWTCQRRHLQSIDVRGGRQLRRV